MGWLHLEGNGENGAWTKEEKDTAATLSQVIYYALDFSYNLF